MTEPAPPCRPISKDNPATLTVLANAFAKEGSETYPVEGMDDLHFLAENVYHPPSKKKAELYCRGELVGKRLKRNIRIPLLVILDVDKSEISMTEALKRLEVLGIAAVGYTTWSHNPEADVSSYRILTDLVAPGWEEIRFVTETIFKLISIKATNESSTSPWFFYPATPKSNASEYRYGRTSISKTTWTPPPFAPRPPAEMKKIDRVVGTDEELQILDAITYIDNDPRENWLKVAFALHDARISDAKSVWDDWSAFECGKYSQEDQDSTWAGIVNGIDRPSNSKTTVRTLYHLAYEGGWAPPRPTRSPLEDFGPYLTDRARQLLTFNESYAFVGTGRGVVADLSPGREIKLRSINAFLLRHTNPRFETGEIRNKRPVTVAVSSYWLNKWPSRRTYDEIDFMPEGGPPLPEGTLNLWRGWPKLADGPGSAQPLLDHIFENACDGNREIYDRFFAWMAHLIQRPHKKIGTALVLLGEEGVGKGVIGSAILKLVGHYGLQVTQPGLLSGHFNFHLANKIFVFADEVTWGGRKQEEGVLKGLITEAHGTFTPKGFDSFSGHSFVNVFISTNERWPLTAGKTARRWQCLRVNPRHRGDEAYFGRIIRELENGGYRDLFNRLRHANLDEFPSPTDIISTPELVDQKVESLDSVDRWIYGFLDAGEFRTGDGWPRSADDRVPFSELFRMYEETARRDGSTFLQHRSHVGRRLKDLFGPVGMEIRRSGKAKVVFYDFPELDVCRQAFADDLHERILVWNDADAKDEVEE